MDGVKDLLVRMRRREQVDEHRGLPAPGATCDGHKEGSAWQRRDDLLVDRAITGELGRIKAERAALVHGEHVVSYLLLRQSFLSRLRCCFGVIPLEYISKMAY
jgi:hypothetical protein